MAYAWSDSEDDRYVTRVPQEASDSEGEDAVAFRTREPIEPPSSPPAAALRCCLHSDVPRHSSILSRVSRDSKTMVARQREALPVVQRPASATALPGSPAAQSRSPAQGHRFSPPFPIAGCHSGNELPAPGRRRVTAVSGSPQPTATSPSFQARDEGRHALSTLARLRSPSQEDRRCQSPRISPQIVQSESFLDEAPRPLPKRRLVIDGGSEGDTATHGVTNLSASPPPAVRQPPPADPLPPGSPRLLGVEQQEGTSQGAAVSPSGPRRFSLSTSSPRRASREATPARLLRDGCRRGTTNSQRARLGRQDSPGRSLGWARRDDRQADYTCAESWELGRTREPGRIPTGIPERPEGKPHASAEQERRPPLRGGGSTDRGSPPDQRSAPRLGLEYGDEPPLPSLAGLSRPRGCRGGRRRLEPRSLSPSPNRVARRAAVSSREIRGGRNGWTSRAGDWAGLPGSLRRQDFRDEERGPLSISGREEFPAREASLNRCSAELDRPPIQDSCWQDSFLGPDQHEDHGRPRSGRGREPLDNGWQPPPGRSLPSRGPLLRSPPGADYGAFGGFSRRCSVDCVPPPESLVPPPPFCQRPRLRSRDPRGRPDTRCTTASPLKRKHDTLPPPHVIDPHSERRGEWPATPAGGKQRRVAPGLEPRLPTDHSPPPGRWANKLPHVQGMVDEPPPGERRHQPRSFSREPGERLGSESRSHGRAGPMTKGNRLRSPMSQRSSAPSRSPTRPLSPMPAPRRTAHLSADMASGGNRLLFPDFGGSTAVSIPLPASSRGHSIGRLMLSFEAKSLDILQHRVGFSLADFRAREPKHVCARSLPELLPRFLRSSLDDPLASEPLAAYLRRVDKALRVLQPPCAAAPFDSNESLPTSSVSPGSFPPPVLSVPSLESDGAVGDTSASVSSASVPHEVARSVSFSKLPPSTELASSEAFTALSGQPSGHSKDRRSSVRYPQFPPALVDYYLDSAKVQGTHADKYKPLNRRFDFVTRMHLWCLRPGDGECLSGRLRRTAAGQPARSVELNADVMNVWTILMQEWHDQLRDLAETLRNPDVSDSPERMRDVGASSPTSLPESRPKCWFLSTDFITTLEHALAPQKDTNSGSAPGSLPPRNGEVNAAAIKEIEPTQGWAFACERLWRFCLRRKACFWDYDFVCWPCNYVTAHWVLIVADLRRRRLFWLDSYQECYRHAWIAEARRASIAAASHVAEAERELRGLFQEGPNDDEYATETIASPEAELGASLTRSRGPLTRHRVHRGSRILGNGKNSLRLPVGVTGSTATATKECASHLTRGSGLFRDRLTKDLLQHTGWIHFEVVERCLRWDYEKRCRERPDSWQPNRHAMDIMEDPRPWERIIVRDLPQQEKLSLDCGVYVGHFLRCVGQFGDPTVVDFDSSEVRSFREMMAILIARGTIHTDPRALQREVEALKAAGEILEERPSEPVASFTDKPMPVSHANNPAAAQKDLVTGNAQLSVTASASDTPPAMAQPMVPDSLGGGAESGSASTATPPEGPEDKRSLRPPSRDEPPLTKIPASPELRSVRQNPQVLSRPRSFSNPAEGAHL